MAYAYGNEINACNSSRWDNYESDIDSIHASDTISAVHIVSSLISAMCCVVVLGVSATYEQLRRFPNNMLLWKTGCDLITSVVLVGVNIALLTMPQRTSVERGARICQNGALAGIAGFSLLASPGWFCAIAVNLNRSIHDPFTKPQSRMRKMHTWVWGTSLAVGVSVGVLHEYRPNLHMCWSCHGTSGVFSWVLLFGWLAAYFLLAVVVMLDAWYWLMHARGVTDRLSSRAHQMRASVLHIGTIGTQWLLTGVSFALTFETSDHVSALPYRVIFALSLGLLGVADLASWLATSLPTLREMRLRSRLRKLIIQSDLEQDDVPAIRDVTATESEDAHGTDTMLRSLPIWIGSHMLQSSRQKKKMLNKKKQKKREADLGDISDALRREFVQFTISGIALGANEMPQTEVEPDVRANGKKTVAAVDIEVEMHACEMQARYMHARLSSAQQRSPATHKMRPTPLHCVRPWSLKRIVYPSRQFVWYGRGLIGPVRSQATTQSSDRGRGGSEVTRPSSAEGDSRDLAKRMLMSVKDSVLGRTSSVVAPIGPVSCSDPLVARSGLMFGRFRGGTRGRAS